MVAVGSLESEFSGNPSLSMVNNTVNCGLKPVLVSWNEVLHELLWLTLERIFWVSERQFCVVSDRKLIVLHRPVKNDVSAPRKRKCTTCKVRNFLVGQAPARDNLLHDCETDQHDNQYEAANQRIGCDVGMQIAEKGKSRRSYPNKQDKPGWQKQRRTVICMSCEIDDQQKSDCDSCTN